MIVHSPHALELHLHEIVAVGPAVLGVKQARCTGEFVFLRPGRNKVADDFWRLWAEQNKGSPLLAAFITEEESRDARSSG